MPSSPCRVTRTRAPRHSEALAIAAIAGGAVVAAVACGASSAPVQAPSAAVSSSSGEPPPREPDGVVLEPPPAIPSAVAHAPARGVVALTEPLGGDAVRALVAALLDAWQRESLDALLSLTTQDAGPFDARSRGRGALVEGWRERLRSHEYGRLAGMELVRPERIERWAYDDLGGPDEPPRPPGMRPGELYVRVPLEVTRVAGDKLFDDDIVLILRREDDRYEIAAYGETDEP